MIQASVELREKFDIGKHNSLNKFDAANSSAIAPAVTDTVVLDRRFTANCLNILEQGNGCSDVYDKAYIIPLSTSCVIGEGYRVRDVRRLIINKTEKREKEVLACGMRNVCVIASARNA